MCGGSVRLIAFIAEGAQIRQLLEHVGVDIPGPASTVRDHGCVHDDGAKIRTGKLNCRIGGNQTGCFGDRICDLPLQ